MPAIKIGEIVPKIGEIGCRHDFGYTQNVPHRMPATNFLYFGEIAR